MSDVTKRLERIIESDASGVVRATLTVAQSDVLALLCEFMDVRKFDMTADKSNNGYTVRITAEVSRFYGVGNTSEEN